VPSRIARALARWPGRGGSERSEGVGVQGRSKRERAVSNWLTPTMYKEPQGDGLQSFK
jgi:hypothetical protein